MMPAARARGRNGSASVPAVVFAGTGYLLAALFVWSGVNRHDLVQLAAGLLALAIGLLAANVGNIRTRIPGISASSPMVATGAWAAVVGVSMCILGVAIPTLPGLYSDAAVSVAPPRPAVDAATPTPQAPPAITPRSTPRIAAEPTEWPTPASSTPIPLTAISALPRPIQTSAFATPALDARPAADQRSPLEVRSSVGQPVTVTTDQGARLTITVNSVSDYAQPTNQWNDSDGRWVVVEWTIRNDGIVSYDFNALSLKIQTVDDYIYDLGNQAGHREPQLRLARTLEVGDVEGGFLAYNIGTHRALKAALFQPVGSRTLAIADLSR
jgi:hypothetical protein